MQIQPKTVQPIYNAHNARYSRTCECAVTSSPVMSKFAVEMGCSTSCKAAED